MKTRLIICMLGVCISLSHVHGASGRESVPYLPVVKIFAYDLAYGEYPKIISHGSASVIGTDGLLLSNHHVVHDQYGMPVDALVVCATTRNDITPVCDYTASIVDADESLDLALLRIDPVDVQGDTIEDFSMFSFFEFALKESIDTTEEVTALGYPAIGTDTLSRTRGVISGTVEFSGYRYIKTDALIAGGNSGGALLDDAGRLLGVPTFIRFDETQGSLGYALDISEAREWISEHSEDTPTPRDEDALNRILSVRRAMANARMQDVLSDPIFTLKNLEHFVFEEYIPEHRVVLSSRGDALQSVSGVSVEFFRLARFADEEGFLHMLRVMGLYDPDAQTIRKYADESGDFPLYRVISRFDASWGSAEINRQFFAPVWENGGVLFQFFAEAWYEDAEISEDIETFFRDFDLSDSASKHAPAPLSFPALGIEIPASDSLSAFPESGAFMVFFGKEDRGIHIILTPRWSDENTAFDSEAEYRTVVDGYPNDTHEQFFIRDTLWYILCPQQTWYSVGFAVRDADGLPFPEIRGCSIVFPALSGSDGVRYSLEAYVYAPSASLEKAVEVGYEFLGWMLDMDISAEALPNPARTIEMPYADLFDQSRAYRQKIAWLYEHGLLPDREYFGADEPITYREFFDIYLLFEYGFRPDACETCRSRDDIGLVRISDIVPQTMDDRMLAEIFSVLSIDLDAYVPLDALDTPNIDTALTLAFLGVPTDELTLENIRAYEESRNIPRVQEWQEWFQRLEQYVHGPRRIYGYEVLSETDTHYSLTQTFLAHDDSVIRVQRDPDELADFSSQGARARMLQSQGNDDTESHIALLSYCIETADPDCETKLRESEYRMRMHQSRIELLTRWILIDFLSSFLDYGLFDEALARKKDRTIFEE